MRKKQLYIFLRAFSIDVEKDELFVAIQNTNLVMENLEYRENGLFFEILLRNIGIKPVKGFSEELEKMFLMQLEKA